MYSSVFRGAKWKMRVFRGKLGDKIPFVIALLLFLELGAFFSKWDSLSTILKHMKLWLSAEKVVNLVCKTSSLKWFEWSLYTCTLFLNYSESWKFRKLRTGKKCKPVLRSSSSRYLIMVLHYLFQNVQLLQRFAYWLINMFIVIALAVYNCRCGHRRVFVAESMRDGMASLTETSQLLLVGCWRAHRHISTILHLIASKV